MKKINIFLIAISLLMNIGAFAQELKLSKDFTVTTGTPYQVVDGATKDYLSDGKFAYSVKIGGEKVTVQKFDFVNTKEVSRNEYEDFPPYMKPVKTMQLGDKIFYIYSTINKKEKNEAVYAREINKDNGSFKEPKLLFTTTSEIMISGYAEGATSLFNLVGIRYEVYSSFDQSKLLVRYRTRPLNKDDSKNFDILGFYVFNSSLEKQWGGEAKMPYTEKQMNNLAYTVGADGTAYMLAYLTESKSFELFAINKDLNVKTNKIDLDGKLYFQEFKLRETIDGNLIATGYYANGIDYQVNWTGNAAMSFNINGILSFKMTPTGKVLEKYNFEFPIDLINQYESARTKEKNAEREEKGKAGINDLKIVSLVTSPDGSMTVIGEQQYIRNEFVGTSQRQVYYYGDVVATKFDKKGTLLWMKKLPKTQVGFMGKGGMGIRFIKGQGTNYVLYLDNIKNADISVDKVPEKHQDGKGGYLTAYKIDDATGTVTKAAILDIKNINGIEAFQFKTPRIFDATDKIFLLELYMKGKQDTMVKMELKN